MKKINDTENIFELKNLAIGYTNKKKEKIIGKGININIEKGKLIALIGGNGIGKSTLLKTLANTTPKLSGEIFLKKKKIEDYSTRELSLEISIVHTKQFLENNLTVFELVSIGRYPHTNWLDQLTETDKIKINTALKLTDTESLAKKRFFELSDGQQQSVLIARALAQDTEIIILDEPTNHLDMHHSFKIFLLLKKLVEKHNKTILFSTHKINLALKTANEFITIENKKIAKGNKKHFIDKNIFNTLFPQDITIFNPVTHQFEIKTK